MGALCTCQPCGFCGPLHCCCYGYRGPGKIQRVDPLNSDWMAELAKFNPNLPLFKTVMLATHDSGTYSIQSSTCFSNISRTQKFSIKKQLEIGVRMFDLRFGGTGNEASSVFIYHGIVSGGHIRDILDQVVEFFKEHKSEFVILKMRKEYGRKMNEHQIEYVYQQVKLRFEKFMVKIDEDKWWKYGQASIGEVLKSPKRVLILYHDSLLKFKLPCGTQLEDFGPEKKGIWRQDNLSEGKWHDTEIGHKLFKGCLECVKTRHLAMFHVSKFSPTPGIREKTDYCKLLCGCKDLRVDKLLKPIYEQDYFESKFRKNCSEDWNCISFDFVSYLPFMNKFLVSLNYSEVVKLSIVRAYVQNRKNEMLEVTERCREITKECRGCSLFLINIINDLGLAQNKNFKKGQFLVYYRFERIGEKNKSPTRRQPPLSQAKEPMLEVSRPNGEKGEKKIEGISNFYFEKNTEYLLSWVTKEVESLRVADGGFGQTGGLVSNGLHFELDEEVSRRMEKGDVSSKMVRSGPEGLFSQKSCQMKSLSKTMTGDSAIEYRILDGDMKVKGLIFG